LRQREFKAPHVEEREGNEIRSGGKDKTPKKVNELNSPSHGVKKDLKRRDFNTLAGCVCEWYSETLTNVRILYKTADFANCIN
jgi:hypothetical protein